VLFVLFKPCSRTPRNRARARNAKHRESETEQATTGHCHHAHQVLLSPLAETPNPQRLQLQGAQRHCGGVGAPSGLRGLNPKSQCQRQRRAQWSLSRVAVALFNYNCLRRSSVVLCRRPANSIRHTTAEASAAAGIPGRLNVGASSSSLQLYGLNHNGMRQHRTTIQHHHNGMPWEGPLWHYERSWLEQPAALGASSSSLQQQPAAACSSRVHGLWTKSWHAISNNQLRS
jgi:hypothetical protein